MTVAPLDICLRQLECIVARFARPDSNGLLDVADEHLPVTDLPSPSRRLDGVDNRFGAIVGHDNVDLDFRNEIDGVFGSECRRQTPPCSKGS